MGSARAQIVSADARSGERWADASRWVGDGICREVFFFDSGGVRLYGSLYAAIELSRPLGVLACNSWGVEADRSEPMLRSIVIEMARRGGAGMVFHYPGYGDSYGDLAAVEMEQLSAAVVDAIGEASRRRPGVEWILAGFMFGASVACPALKRAAVEQILLVQPALRPAAYFGSLSASKKPLPRMPGPLPNERMESGTAPGMAYSYPIPNRLVERGSEADAAVSMALAEYEGEGVVVAHTDASDPLPVPERFERVEVPGSWRFGSLNNPRLTNASIEWLDRHNHGGDR